MDGTEERPPAPEGARGPLPEGSRGKARVSALRSGSGRVGLAVLALGTVAAALMVVAELAPVAEIELTGGLGESCEARVVDEAQRDRCSLSGLDRHSGALLLLALAAAVMAFGAGPGGSRPAAAALLAIGAVVLVISLVIDLPETSKTGLIGMSYDGAKGVRGIGFYAELLGGALAVAAGLMRLANPR